MQYLKLWESWEAPKTKRQVAEICEAYNIRKWRINSDGRVDVLSDVDLSSSGLEEHLPLKFGKVTGFFDCSYNNLSTLEGAPYSVGSYFDCSHNHLKSLEGGPLTLRTFYYCNHNFLQTLNHSPQIINDNFECAFNHLTDLEGSPTSVKGNFVVYRNKLETFKGAPKIIGRNFNFCGNDFPIRNKSDFYRITSLEGLPHSINGESADKWVISRIKKKMIRIAILHTLPDYVLTATLLGFIRNISKKQYDLIKLKREDDERWKTELSADLGDLGF